MIFWEISFYFVGKIVLACSEESRPKLINYEHNLTWDSLRTRTIGDTEASVREDYLPGCTIVIPSVHDNVCHMTQYYRP